MRVNPSTNAYPANTDQAVSTGAIPRETAAAGEIGHTMKTTWDTAVSDWITAMHAAGRSPRTIRLYRCHLGKIIRECPDGPDSVTPTDLRYILACGRWKPETRKSVRGTLGSFFRWAHGTGIVDVDPTRGLDTVRVPAGVARPIPEDVLHEALSHADERDRMMLMLGAYAGLRCMEIARVHSRDWDGSGLYVTGKGGKTRYVPIVRIDLRRILTACSGYLFPGQDGGHLSPGYVSKRLARALPGKWTAHTLRHRCGTVMYAGTRDLLAVGAVLGHARPETTLRYVRLPQDALIDAVRAAA